MRNNPNAYGKLFCDLTNCLNRLNILNNTEAWSLKPKYY